MNLRASISMSRLTLCSEFMSTNANRMVRMGKIESRLSPFGLVAFDEWCRTKATFALSYKEVFEPASQGP